MTDVLLALDIDWAPDYAIDLAATELARCGVRATWFVTHASAAVDRLRGRPDLFVLGIHPNFLANSTHGASPADVLAHCMQLVPDARSVRTHSLVQSTPLLGAILAQTPIVIDGSLFLPGAAWLRPVEYRSAGKTLLRLPFYWEDDVEMQQPTSHWRLNALLGVEPGLKVFAFHPLHVFLNSDAVVRYEALKGRHSKISELSESEAARLVRPGPGAGTLFTEILEFMADRGGGLRFQDVLRRWTTLHLGDDNRSTAAVLAELLTEPA